MSGSPRGSDAVNYMPQLDALRGIAALAVIIFHLGPYAIPAYTPLGLWGVELFFVLSGFLITGILLQCRESSHSRLYELRQFYIRRSLRIFPLYYLIILGLFVLGQPNIREALFWHLTYTSNIYIALQNSWPGSTSHLWSLSIEEQFYLIWPWFLLFLPRPAIVPAIVTMILVALLYRAIGTFLGFQFITLQVLVPGALDALGLGALLGAWRYRDAVKFASIARRSLYRWLGLFLLIIMVGVRLIPHWSLSPVFSPFCSALLFVWLIHQSAVGIRGPIGQFLEAKPMLYLGRISYGLYLWHNFVPGIVTRILNYSHIRVPEQPTVRFALYLSAIIVIASCSWLWFERPINNLKNRFSYR